LPLNARTACHDGHDVHDDHEGILERYVVIIVIFVIVLGEPWHV
jgi:hypothetical protein